VVFRDLKSIMKFDCQEGTWGKGGGEETPVELLSTHVILRGSSDWGTMINRQTRAW